MKIAILYYPEHKQKYDKITDTEFLFFERRIRIRYLLF